MKTPITEPRRVAGASTPHVVPPRDRRRALIVDDSHLMRAYYRSILAPEGFDIDEAQNGLEGLECAMRTRPDVMIVDVNMPKLDGYRMMQELRRDPDLGDVPAIMISTQSGEADRRRALESGASRYLVKPVKPEQLRAEVRDALAASTP